jgi:hypothetical protein
VWPHPPPGYARLRRQAVARSGRTPERGSRVVFPGHGLWRRAAPGQRGQSSLPGLRRPRRMPVRGPADQPGRHLGGTTPKSGVPYAARKARPGIRGCGCNGRGFTAACRDQGRSAARWLASSDAPKSCPGRRSTVWAWSACRWLLPYSISRPGSWIRGSHDEHERRSPAPGTWRSGTGGISSPAGSGPGSRCAIPVLTRQSPTG